MMNKILKMNKKKLKLMGKRGKFIFQKITITLKQLIN